MKKSFGKFGIVYAAGLFALTLFLATGCEKNGVEPPAQQLELDKATVNGLVSGWQTIHSLNTLEDVSATVSGDLPVEKSTAGGIYSPEQLRQQFTRLHQGLMDITAEQRSPSGTAEDSLVWFIDWTDPVSGISVRKALYYDSQTGFARYYEAIYQFPPQVQLSYDSTEIRVDLNFTLFDSTDDRLLSLYKLSDFEDGFYIDRIEANAEVTDYGAGNEITGAILENTVRYGEQNELETLTQRLEFRPDNTGTVQERLDYRDGTFAQKTVNFYSNYTGDFSEKWRDGTQVTGTFNSLEDDNQGSFTRTITFPAGNDPMRISQSALATLNPADSSSFLSLNEKIFFLDGAVDTSQLDINEYFENGLKKTNLEGWNSDGSHALLLITHYSDYKELEGNYTGPDGYFTLINATLYNDGSGDMWLKIYQSEEAYNNGEPPLATIYIHFNPDGSGNGEITKGADKYQVQVAPNGKMKVVDDQGKQQDISGF